MSTPMLMILKKYNVTQVIIKCFHVPPAVCLRTPRGTRTPGWESLLYRAQVWALTGPKHEPDGFVLKPHFGGLAVWAGALSC